MRLDIPNQAKALRLSRADLSRPLLCDEPYRAVSFRAFATTLASTFTSEPCRCDVPHRPFPHQRVSVGALLLK